MRSGWMRSLHLDYLAAPLVVSEERPDAWGLLGTELDSLERFDIPHFEAAVDEVIAANPGQVAKAADNPKLAGWFVGQVMKATQGKANPQAVNEMLRKKLDG